jgi:hypothetical protein
MGRQTREVLGQIVQVYLGLLLLGFLLFTYLTCMLPSVTFLKAE